MQTTWALHELIEPFPVLEKTYSIWCVIIKPTRKVTKAHKTDQMEKFIRPTENRLQGRRWKMQKDHNANGR